MDKPTTEGGENERATVYDQTQAPLVCLWTTANQLGGILDMEFIRVRFAGARARIRFKLILLAACLIVVGRAVLCD